MMIIQVKVGVGVRPNPSVRQLGDVVEPVQIIRKLGACLETVQQSHGKNLYWSYQNKRKNINQAQCHLTSNPVENGAQIHERSHDRS